MKLVTQGHRHKEMKKISILIIPSVECSGVCLKEFLMLAQGTNDGCCEVTNPGRASIWLQ